jgi:hypothetical protein
MAAVRKQRGTILSGEERKGPRSGHGVFAFWMTLTSTGEIIRTSTMQQVIDHCTWIWVSEGDIFATKYRLRLTLQKKKRMEQA